MRNDCGCDTEVGPCASHEALMINAAEIREMDRNEEW